MADAFENLTLAEFVTQWGRRGGPDDDLLPPDQQSPLIAEAMRALAARPTPDGLREALNECADKLWVARCNSTDPQFREAAEKACDMASTALASTQPAQGAPDAFRESPATMTDIFGPASAPDALREALGALEPFARLFWATLKDIGNGRVLVSFDFTDIKRANAAATSLRAALASTQPARAGESLLTAAKEMRDALVAAQPASDGESAFDRIKADPTLARARAKLSADEIVKIIRHVKAAYAPRKHVFWGAGEPDCPREIKASNGELHTLRCKACGLDNPRDEYCAAAVVSTQPAQEPARKFQIGDRVTKVRGSQWTGRVVGTYSTALTHEGYAVESETELGSVQIYPAAALEAAPDAQPVQEGK